MAGGVVCAGPAGAHAQFQGVKSVAPNTDSPITMFVPHERDETKYNVKIVVAVASGWQAVSCEQKSTWTCVLGQSGGSSVITFAKDVGAARDEDETFVFTVHSHEGIVTSPFPTQQVYDDGEAVNWSGPPGSAEPAPLLRTLEPGQSAAPVEPATPTEHAAPATTADPGALGTASVAPVPSASATPLDAGIVIPPPASASATSPAAGTEIEADAASVTAQDDGSALLGIVGVVAVLVLGAGALTAAAVQQRRRKGAQ